MRRLLLCLFLVPTGHHEASWRSPAASPHRLYDPTYYREVVQRAEAARFDAVFLADAPALRTDVRYNSGGSVLEPATLLTYLAGSTRHIGLIGTASTTYNEPYNLARLFSSLDHISGGRAGWNIVTTAFEGAAANFGSEHPSREERYQRAEEFVRVVKGLWGSWQPDAIIRDVAAGRFADVERISRLDHRGRHFSVRGPFQSARSPQVWPVLVQAGASPAGRSLAAQHADLVFSVQRTKRSAQAFATDVRNRAIQLGRSPEGIRFLPGVSIFVGASRAEALEKKEHLDALMTPAYGLQQISTLTGKDASQLDLDENVSPRFFDTRDEDLARYASRRVEIVAMVEDERMTLRQLLTRLAGARAHRVLAGSPNEVVDSLAQWFLDGACDGFNIMPPVLPAALDDFISLVLPLLRERGLVDLDYSADTFRGNLGLSAVE